MKQKPSRVSLASGGDRSLWVRGLSMSNAEGVGHGWRGTKDESVESEGVEALRSRLETRT